MMVLISVIILLGAFVLCVLANVLTRKISTGFGVLMCKGIPVVGGLSIWGAFCIAACWGASVQKVPFVEAGAILGASFVMLVFGIIDDQKELSVALKFFTQIFSVSLLMYFGVKIQIVYIGPYINALLTLIWVIGIINAFNHLDISDGVAGFIGLLTSSAFLAISILNHDKSNTILSLALCGALAGFLVFNFPPAKIYMGNAGSHFLGFVFAAIAIAISYAPLERKAALVSPILILGLPILDTAFLILVRIWKRKIPFLKSNDHIILRLKSLGYSPRKIFLVMGLWGLFFVGAGIAVSQFPNAWGLFILALAGFFSFNIIKIISKVSVND